MKKLVVKDKEDGKILLAMDYANQNIDHNLLAMYGVMAALAWKSKNYKVIFDTILSVRNNLPKEEFYKEVFLMHYEVLFEDVEGTIMNAGSVEDMFK